jgi:galactoside O-acetyltransferase
MSIIQYIISKLFLKGRNGHDLDLINKFIEVDKSSIIDTPINVRLDNPDTNAEKKYLTIGKNCIIHGTFVFESTEGKIEIGNHSYIGASTFISKSSISIGNNVTIAWGCTIYDHDSHSMDFLDRRKDIDDELRDIRNGDSFILNKDWSKVKSEPIRICDDSWIGMNSIILKGVTIGEGAIVGAGSVVTKDVPAWTVVAGNPARVVKTLQQ